MFDLVFLVSYLSIPLLFVSFFMLSGRISITINFVNILIRWIFITQYLGLLPLYFQLVETRISVVSDKTILFRLWFFTSFTILSLLAGDRLFHLALRRPGNGVSAVMSHDMVSVRARRLGKLMLVWGGIAGLLLLQVNAKFDSPGVFIQSFLDAESTIARREMVNFESGIPSVNLNILFFSVLPLVSLVIYFSMLPGGWVQRYVLSNLFLLAGVGVVLLSAAKAPPLDFLLAFALAHLLRRGHAFETGTSIIFKAVIAATVVGYFMMRFTYGGDSGWDPLINLFDRLCLGQLQSSYLYLQTFPEQVAYLGGRSLPFISSVAGEGVNLSSLVYERAAMQHGFAPGGSSPTIFWGELYANFGLSGVLLSPLIVGFMLNIPQYALRLLSTRAARPAVIGWFCIHYKTLGSTSLSSFVLDLHLAYALLILLAIKVTVPLGRRPGPVDCAQGGQALRP